MKILNFGSLNIDHVYDMEHFVKAKETVSAMNYHLQIGGKGLNQSVALARAKMKVYHAGKIGADGTMLCAYLEENGVDTSYIRESGKASGHAIIQVVDGENCIIVYGGANRDIDADMIEDVLSDFEQGDLLLLQNEISNVDVLIQKAHAKGMKIVLNPSPIDESLLKGPVAACDILLLNEVEGAALAAYAGNSYEEIIHALAKRYPQMEIVLTCGAQGAFAYQKGNFLHQDAFHVTAVDTTCAGDTFTGFYLSARIRGCGIKEALMIACKASSFSVQKQGAAKSIPAWEEVIQALAEKEK